MRWLSLDVAAPIDGVITRVLASRGQKRDRRDATVHPDRPKALEVHATVVEEDFPLVSVGQPVELYFDALPETTVTGKVARIIPERSSESTASYPIVVTL